MGPLDEVPSLPAAGGLVGVHGPLEVEAQRLVGLAVAVERPHQFRIAERESITGRPVVAPGVPRMPGLAVAVDQLREEGVLGRLRQAGRDELAGEDLVVMGMPVALLVLRQRLKQPFRDDVLDADQVGVLRVAVEQDALDEVLVDLATEVVGLHLHVRLVLGAVQTCDIDVEVLQRRHVLQERRAGLERLAPHRAALSGGRHRARAAADLRVDHAGRPTRVTTARHEASAMTSWRARPGGFAGRAPQRRPPHAQARRDDTHVVELTAAEGTDSTIAGPSRGRSARSRGSSPTDRLSAARRGYCARRLLACDAGDVLRDRVDLGVRETALERRHAAGLAARDDLPADGGAIGLELVEVRAHLAVRLRGGERVAPGAVLREHLLALSRGLLGAAAGLTRRRRLRPRAAAAAAIAAAAAAGRQPRRDDQSNSEAPHRSRLPRARRADTRPQPPRRGAGLAPPAVPPGPPLRPAPPP